MTGQLAVETERLRRVYTTRGATGRASKIVVLDDVTPCPDTRAHGAAALEAAFLTIVGRRTVLAGT